MLKGNTFAPYQAQNGKFIEYLYHGSRSAGDIFDAEHSYNTTRTWFLRFFGTVLMFIGLSIISRIVVTLGKFFHLLQIPSLSLLVCI